MRQERHYTENGVVTEQSAEKTAAQRCFAEKEFASMEVIAAWKEPLGPEPWVKKAAVRVIRCDPKRQGGVRVFNMARIRRLAKKLLPETLSDLRYTPSVSSQRA